MAKKLHQQFVDSAQDKLLQLINKVGYQWSNNMELLKNEIGKISKSALWDLLYVLNSH